jgi:hypothetical protein
MAPRCVLRFSRYGLKDENPYFNARNSQLVTRNDFLDFARVGGSPNG